MLGCSVSYAESTGGGIMSVEATTIKDSIIKVLLIILIAVAVGFALGKYSPNILGKDSVSPATPTGSVEAEPNAPQVER